MVSIRANTLWPEMTSDIRHYFVDEHGDGTLFNAKGREIVGSDGCSSHFALGVLDVPDPEALSAGLEELRRSILSRPMFRGVESLKPERRKTALAFHAKDDIPEVRMLVFEFLASQDVRFQAVIRCKRAIVDQVRNWNQQSTRYHYHPNRLYDEMVKRLFKNRLHQAASYRICFATRGSKDRSTALKSALESARAKFRKAWGIDSNAPIEVLCMPSEASGSLQAVDYFLWALQRVYTKGEDRFLAALWSRISLIVDVDDRRHSSAGCYYSREKPLTSEAIKKEPGI